MGWFRNRKRKKLRGRAVPPAWHTIVGRRVPYVAFLSEADRRELFGHIHVFLAEKHFEGVGGLALTDDMKVTIAAQACLLLLHRDTDYFPHCDSIIVYPHAYVASVTHTDAAGVVTEGNDVRLGESWQAGLVVLAWDDVLRGAERAQDGYNVVLHEFAHQLDEESGVANGTPKLANRAAYSDWAKVMYEEFRALIEAAEHRQPTDLDPYGATNPAEFFAVITEAFFERPGMIQSKHPAMYERLKAYYRQDPAVRMAQDPPSTARSLVKPPQWLLRERPTRLSRKL